MRLEETQCTIGATGLRNHYEDTYILIRGCHESNIGYNATASSAELQMKCEDQTILQGSKVQTTTTLVVLKYISTCGFRKRNSPLVLQDCEILEDTDDSLIRGCYESNIGYNAPATSAELQMKSQYCESG